MKAIPFPISQRELLLAARGAESQTTFAKRLGVHRSCLSRYEQEKLGAPTSVLNECLKLVACQLESGECSALEEALMLVRRATAAIERAAKMDSAPARAKSMIRQRRRKG